MGMHKNNNEAVSKIREEMWRLARHNQIIEDEIYRMVIDAMAAFDDFLFPDRFSVSSASVSRAWRPPPSTKRT